MTSTGIYILISGSLKKKGYWLILYCIIDWGMIGLMFLGLIWQSYYLPSTLKACDRAKSWQLIGKETSLFWLVGRQTHRTPLNMCDEYMLVWILNICTMWVSSYWKITVCRWPDTIEYSWGNQQYTRYWESRYHGRSSGCMATFAHTWNLPKTFGNFSSPWGIAGW